MENKWIKNHSQLVLGLLIALLLSPSWVGADQDTVQLEQEMLSLINEARRAPLAMAESLGLDGEKLVADLPELAGILNNGLDPLTVNDKLEQAAMAHTDDMLTNQYYASVSLDGLTVRQRFNDVGYEAIAAGETLGLLSFDNFMQSQLAVHHIFKNMFLDELNANNTQQRTILNPLFKEVGVAIKSGSMQIGPARFNAYLATCDYGSDTVDELVLQKMEQQLVQLINQARVKPLQVKASLSVVEGDGVRNISEVYPPLATDQRLTQAARLHVDEVIADDWLAGEVGWDFTERLSAYDYDVLEGGEIMARVKVADYPVPAHAVQQLFEQMILNELNPLYLGEFFIYNEQLRDTGVGISIGEMTESGQTDLYYVASCSLATENRSYKPSLIGMVYNDKNDDGLYNPGEGIEGQPVIYYDSGLHMRSNEVGAVQHEIKAGGDLVVLFSRTDELQFVELFTINLNKWFDFEIGNL